MSCLPGWPVLTPEDLGWWAGELAGALTAIPGTATQELPGPLRGWPGESERWPPPSQYDNARTRAIPSSVSASPSTARLAAATLPRPPDVRVAECR
jgi:hypothetical protein